MMTFACKDMGVECNFSASAATKEDLLQKIMAHGNTVHADLMASFTPEQATAFAGQVEATIKTA